ncbi:MAG: universal stress protein [Tabrizicola sp.]|uniref:universal stress protein n=1 Tax=Tabrizicola sp. TaxID=2005166 RepID=UPI0027354EE1|nr:universal stress protein [Tabrizicola sp.]MDP3265084.1 universal stress protein [Tabrizicola sp.]MDP3647373.1 universal stress protein [Paracoccaceae bacterium]MDZ4068639.1 universal stress protein [Tabrizicola sp.]
MYRTILLAYDGSLEGRLALREGARLAQVCGARVVLMAIVEPSSEFFVGGVGGVYIPPDRTEEVQKILDEGLARLNGMGLVPEGRLERGEPTERISKIALDVSADLVVVGHHKQGAMARWLKGSVTASLSDTLNCSLLVARLEISDEVLFGKDRP